jgi:hypothetical protein
VNTANSGERIERLKVFAFVATIKLAREESIVMPALRRVNHMKLRYEHDANEMDYALWDVGGKRR